MFKIRIAFFFFAALCLWGGAANLFAHVNKKDNAEIIKMHEDNDWQSEPKLLPVAAHADRYFFAWLLPSGLALAACGLLPWQSAMDEYRRGK